MVNTHHIGNMYKKGAPRFILFFILIVLLAFHRVFSQKAPETGLPLIRNYSAENYGAFDQNWAATQDSLGIMYFANGDGVLSYDGSNWNLIKLPNKGSVFALSKSHEGIIYIGAADELGYLHCNSKGQLEYISLLHNLPANYHDFSEIRSLCSTDEGIFFGSKKYIFKWDGEKFTTWENSGDPFLFSVDNTLLKRMQGKGLTVLKDNEFELVSQGEMFAGQRIYSILPFNENKFLLATGAKLFIFNGKGFTPFVTSAPNFFNDNIIYSGTRLNSGSFAFGSLNKGMLIIDPNGHTEVVLSEKGLLKSNSVFGVFQDRSGILWTSLNSGIAKIEYPSPFSLFNAQTGAPDMVFDFQRYQGKLYAGGPEGLFSLNNTNHFELVSTHFGMIWDMILFEDKMLVGGTSGVFEMEPTGKLTKLFELKVSTLHQSKVNPQRVFIGTAYGLTSMLRANGKWVLEKTFNEINVNVDKIVESEEGHLWLDSDKNEVIRVSFDNQRDIQNPKIRIFTPKDGLPDDMGHPYFIENQFYFITGNEGYRFDSTSEKFTIDKNLWVKLGVQNKEVSISFVDEEGRVWLAELDDGKPINQMLATPKNDGTYRLNSLGEQRIMDLRKNGFLAELEDSIIWYKGIPGIVRHNLKKGRYKRIVHAGTVISDVLWKGDSVLSGGYGSHITPELPFKGNQLRFQYTSPNFYDEAKNQFQYYLEGFDENWSPWTLETKKDYTNIPEGAYTFKVRSKNIYGDVGKEDLYTFTILPPWYRTWWAYMAYGLGAVAFVAFILQWRSKELRKKNEVLEGIVKDRTVEIMHKNELLQHQTEKLVQLNDAKTQLYSNITHEFRTPLTVILGMTDTLKSNVENKSFDGASKSLEMIRRNGKNLLQLVNEMLDLAKSESGSLTLQLVQTDVVPLIKYLSESFHSLAEENHINLTVYSEIDTLIMDVDVAKLSAVLSNVLSNAIKFTPEWGKIIVHVNQVVLEKDGHLFIKVKDSGIGIAEEALPHIFDRFYQVNSSTYHKSEGTGIGLALTKELVELMHGTVEVKSAKGRGSEFIIHIPVLRNASVAREVAVVMSEIPMLETKSISNDQTPHVANPEFPQVLIIEDNTDVAHYLKTCFKGKYETLHAVNGKMGVEMAFELMPDIIICDVMMPEMDGHEVCQTLKNDTRTDHIPIIMLTARITSQDKLRGLSHGADAYLTKPFEKAELFTRIDQLILLRKKLVSKLENDSFSSLLKERVEDPQAKFIQLLVQAIHQHLDDSDFGSLHLSREVHLSESQLYRKLKAITGKSTAIFIRSIRLQHARHLLQTTDRNVSEIAYETGFNHPSWFSKAFKEEFGYPPSDIGR